MAFWFGLTAISLIYVVVDIRSSLESPVLKWGFVLLTAYTGPLGAFLYVSLPTTAISAEAPSSMTYSSETMDVVGK